MAISTYSTIYSNTQSTIIGILRSASGLQGIKIVDGGVSDLLRGRGTDLISVHTPTSDEEIMTKTKMRITLTDRIEIITFKESACRTIADLVHAALFDNQDTTRAARLFRYRSRRSDLAIGDLPTQTGNRTMYTITLSAEYEYRGD